jgi:hypothetical protein
MASKQILTAILKEKIGVVEDVENFMKENDVDEQVLKLINEFKELMKGKKLKSKKSGQKSDGKKKPPTFWNNYLKKTLPIVREEQENLQEGDDDWINKEGRWEMKAVAKKWALFKQDDSFKVLEEEYKQTQKESSETEEDDITTEEDDSITKKDEKKNKKTKKNSQKSKVTVDSDDDSDDD